MAKKKETKDIAPEKQDDIIIPESVTDLENAEAEENCRKMMKRLRDNFWGHSKKGVMAVKANMQMLSMKTGIYARVPIYCKGEHCPYADSCITFADGLAPDGQACPSEVAMITQKLAASTKEFGLDKPDASLVDASLVEELILMEASTKRCEALMSQEGNPIQNMVIGMSDNGEAIYQPQVSKAVEAYERFSKKRNADYDLLMATRKNKKGQEDEAGQQDIFSIVEQAQKMDGFYDIEKRPEDAEYKNSE